MGNISLFSRPDTEPTAMREKKKPRGKPFSRGNDSRRNGTEHRAVGAPCPTCEAKRASDPSYNRFGVLLQRVGSFGAFVGCSEYPVCKYTHDSRAATVAAPSTTPTAVDWAGTPNPVAAAPVAVDPFTAAPIVAPTLHPDYVNVGATPSATPTHKPGSLEAIIADIATRAAADSVNEPRVQEIVTARLAEQSEALAEIIAGEILANTDTLRAELMAYVGSMPSSAPTQFAVTVNNSAAVIIDGYAHVALTRVLALASVSRITPSGEKVRSFNIYLVGPAGSGKTTLGQQVAKSLGLAFGTLACAPGLPESALIGRMIPNIMTGDEHYRPSPFVKLYTNGGVFLLDEVDNGDASTLLILNSALDNGHLTLPSGDAVTRHPDFVFLASANTYGHGQSREYVGRTQLDGAFLERFVCSTIPLDYDTELERMLCPETFIRDAVQKVRTKSRALKLRRIVSTRGLTKVRELVMSVGDTLPSALQWLTEGWSAEDRSACGVESV